MKRMILNKKQKKEMDKITTFFMECTEPISDIGERAMVAAKILSHLTCFTDRLTGHLNKNQKWEKVGEGGVDGSRIDCTERGSGGLV